MKAKSPYKIRHDALYGKLENQNYIGRAILHMAKHRGAGFVSAAEELSEEVLEEGEKSKIKKSSYDRMVQYLKDTGSKRSAPFFISVSKKKKIRKIGLSGKENTLWKKISSIMRFPVIW